MQGGFSIATVIVKYNYIASNIVTHDYEVPQSLSIRPNYSLLVAPNKVVKSNVDLKGFGGVYYKLYLFGKIFRYY